MHAVRSSIADDQPRSSDHRRPRVMLLATLKLYDEDVFAITTIPQHERDNIHKVVGQVSFLQTFVAQRASGDRGIANVKKVIAVLTDLIISCTTSGDENPLTREGIPIPAQQDLLTQQNVIDVLMDLLKHTADQVDVSKSSGIQHQIYMISRLAYKLLRQVCSFYMLDSANNL